MDIEARAKRMDETIKKHTQEIRDLQATSDKLMRVFEGIESTLHEILTALKGNELSGDVGLTRTITSLTDRVHRLEKFKDTFWIYATVGGAIISSLIPFVYAFINHKLGW